MTQRDIRRRLRTLEEQQAQRREMVAKTKKLMDDVVVEKQREIDNLRAQVTIRAAQ